MFKRPWPFFLVITALIVWSHLCESCYGFLRPFFNKMSKKKGFATGRLVWKLLRFFTGNNNILPTKLIITVFSHHDQKSLCFWLSRYIYIPSFMAQSASFTPRPQLRSSHRVLPSPPKPGHFNDTCQLRVCELEHGPFIYSWISYFKVVICHILPSGNLSWVLIIYHL